jgi:hypothetical protein
MSPTRGGAWTRLAVTFVVAAGALFLARVPLPGVDESLISQGPGSWDPTVMGILAFGLNPIGTAAFYVEALALAIPRWRAWRLGGYPERERLWARIRILGLVLATIQAFFLLRWLTKFDRDAPVLHLISWSSHLPLLFAVQWATLVAGMFFLFWLTRVIDRWGLGNGFAVILAAFIAPDVAAFVSSIRHHDDTGNGILLPLLLAAVAVVVVTRLAGGRAVRAQPASSRGDELPALSSGVHPINLSRSLLALPSQLAAMGVTLFAIAPSTRMSRAVEVVLIAAACSLLAWLFNRPRLVVQAWQRTGADQATATDRVRSAFARSLAQSIVMCWGLAAVEWMCADAGLAISIMTVVILSCVAMDIAGELRFRRRHGELVAVWPVHRLYTLQGLLSALEAAEIPAFPRCRHYRTLWNFLAPYAPVDIFVPAALAEKAHATLVPLTTAAADVAQPEANPLPA